MKPQDLHTLAAGLMFTATPRPATIEDRHPLADKVDRLGLIRAELDRLAGEADRIRTELEEAGLKSIDGTLYRASFAQVQGTDKTDWKALAARLQPSPQLIRAYTKKSAGYTRMEIKAKPLTH